MIEPNKTRAHIAIYKKDENGYGVGVELLDNHKNEDYYIASLYLPYAEYPNIHRVLYRVLPSILAEVPEDHVGVTFYSNLTQFRKRRELERKNQQFAVGKTLDFKELDQVRRTAINLAIDAVRRGRGNSITERL